jgi:two-component system, oxyanion-binding sensor
MSAATRHMRAGFIPLLDAAPLIVAREQGFAEAEGIDLTLVRETSWASLRDRVAVGHFEAAHMLAPMAIAGSLALPPLPVPFIAPVAFGAGRNAITISQDMRQMMGLEDDAAPLEAADAVARLATAKRAQMPDRPLVFAAVHAYSAHAALLRYWLAEGGLYAGTDVRLEFVPPPFMADALAAGMVDGCCVGEPWSSVAFKAGVGHILVAGDDIWPAGPDKVLGLRADWAAENEDMALRLVRALVAAAHWADDPAHTGDLAAMLAEARYLDKTQDVLLPGLTGRLASSGAGFARGDASRPEPAHAAWFATQMARWGDIDLTPEALAAATATYRPDIYAAALGDNARTGETPRTVTLFDGRIFDPRDAAGYLAALTAS